MARLRFIKGTITGRLGEFVGSRWKGINYIKTYAAPTNPRTEKQMEVRDTFKALSIFATALFKAGVYATFPPYRRMTARNAVIKANKALFTPAIINDEPVAVTLSNISPFTAFSIDDIAIGVPGEVEFDTNATWASNFTYTDFRLHLVAYFAGEQTAYYTNMPATTSNTASVLNVPAGIEQERLVCFAFVTYTDANGKKFISEAARKVSN